MNVNKKGIVVEGIDEINSILDKLLPREANNLSKAFVFGLAQRAAKYAKARVPNRTGNLKKSIAAKRRRGMPGKPVSDVIARSGRGAKYDGFYWRFVEYGTGGKNPQRAQPFMQPARDQIMSESNKLAREVFIDKLSRQIKRAQRRAAKK